MSARSESTLSPSLRVRALTSWWNRRSTATGLATALIASSIGVAVIGNSSASFAVPPAEVGQLANVNNDNNGSDPSEMTLLGNKIIFSAYDDDHGRELWISNSDGSDPKILKDINSDGGANPYGFTVVGTVAYFSADNGVNGQELWKTDGTTAGTVLVRDIDPGEASSSPNSFKPSGSLIFFLATDETGNSLWVTSGTSASTRKIGGIEVATQASNPSTLRELNGLTYFRANDGVHGDELWVSDGTPQGSRMIKDVSPGSGQGVDTIYSLGGRVFFRGNDGVRGWELWTTDGTEAGTQMLRNINPNGDSSLDYLTYAAGKWFFKSNDVTCCDQLRTGQTGYELYVTDGTTTGTRLLKDITTNTPSNNCWWCFGPTNFKPLSNGIIFQQDDGVHGNVWYRSDGTTAGTTSLDPDLNDLLSNNSEPIIIDNKAYFLAGDATNGLEPWVTDGSPTGTRMLADINTNNQSSNVGNMTRVGTTANYVFSSNDGVHGEELWVTDFTDAGTHMVRELQTGTENSGQSSPSGFVSAGNKVFFRAFSDATGWELWVTDGTSVGTRALDLNPGRPDSTWDQLYGLNGKIAFRRQTEATGYEPWISDGTIAGTRMIKEFNPSGNSDLGFAVESNGKIFMKIDDLTQPGYTAVWVTDGTSANTIKLTSRCPNNGNPDPQSFTPVSGGLLFRLSDCLFNYKWWRTDGTVAGTARLDLNYDPLTTGWGDISPVAIGDKYYFIMSTPEFGNEIWITDGSPSGTHVLKDINTVQSGSSSGTGVKLGNKWIFNANDGIHGDELWVSDGTVSGTRMVRELQTGNENSKQSSPSQFVLAGDKVFFRAFSDATGWDLWVTDGTSAGTRALDLNPGRPDASWDQAFALNGRYLFRFYTSEFSYEPWISDGTVAGTHMIKDFNPSGQTELESAIESNGKIYMKLNTYMGYRSLWVTDGTSTNTIKLTLTCASNTDPDPSYFSSVPAGLLFRQHDCVNGHKWWRTDGSVAGTAILNPGYDASKSRFDDVSPVAIGSKYYFTTNTETIGNELWITDGSPVGTYAVKDINTVESGSNSGTGVKLGNKWIFNANDGIHGEELWVSDGTVPGTRMVRELQTGTENSAQSSPSGFVVAGDKVFFRAFSDATGWDLWVTDGTSAGTRALDLNPGRPDASWDQIYGLNGKVVFRFSTESAGQEPWISDGTNAGTHMIMDFNPSGSSGLELAAESNGKIYLKINDGSSPGYTAVWVTDGTSVNTIKLTSRCPNNGNPDPTQFTPVSGGLLMKLSECIYGHKWWRTDGTVAGTARLDLNYDPLTTQWGDISPVAIGNKYYYTMSTPELGNEIWITDGSPSGTHVLKDINTAQGGSNSSGGVKLGNTWIFSANDGIYGDELWVSDGTVSGTRMVRELQTGNENSRQSSPNQFVLAGDKVFFRAFSDATGWDLWVTDGTSAGTRALDLTPGRPDTYWDQIYGLNGKLVFRNHNRDNGFGVEPWISDGTVAGTRMIKDFNPSGDSSLENAVESNGKIYLKINDGSSPSYNAVWVTDGTSANTTQLTTRCANNTNPDPNTFTPVDGGLLMRVNDCIYGHKWWRTDGTVVGTSILNPNYNSVPWEDVSPYQNGGKYYFNARTNEAGVELWVTDGSPSGTRLVKDINTGNEGSNPNSYFKVGNKYFYAANDGIHGQEIWVTDGTSSGTHMVKNFNTNTSYNGGGIVWSGTFNKAGNRAIFSVYDLENGYQLWASDGTELGTVRLTNTAPVNFNHFDGFTAIGSKLIFRARASNERNLWITDGTTAGTFELMNVNDGDDAWNELVTNGSAFAFRTNNTSVGSELFYSDGTVAGTRILDLNEGNAHSSPSNLRFFGNKVAFNARLASFSTTGWDEWMYSDGTIAGTRRLDPDPNDNVYNLVTNPVVLGNNIYYIATSSAHGAELWKSDGTNVGTELVKDVRPGTSGSEINTLYVIGSKIYFAANNGTNGSEPWVSDGTEIGTQMMVDVMPGQSTSGPAAFIGFANKIMFRAQSGTGIVYFATDATTFSTESLGYDQCNGLKSELGNRLIISLISPTGGCEPAITNGTAAGTFFLGDLYPGINGSSSMFAAATPSKVYFTAKDDTYGNELWVTDGTIAGTRRLSDFIVGSGDTPLMNFNVIGEGIWFQYCTCNNWVYGVSDGTVAGTHAADTGVPSRPSNMTSVGSQVIFTSSDIVEGTELWSWSSLTNSTTRIEINPFTGSETNGFITDGTTAIFAANDSEHGLETWISDGTRAGTRLFTDSNVLPQSGSPDSFFTLNGEMYYRAIEFEHGRELWKTDGTSAGTVLVKDINPGVNSSDVSVVGQVGNIVYFSATTSLNGNELWLTDGTATGTRMVKDINTNNSSSRNAEITSFYAGSTSVFFRANDGTTRDLWTSDGTSAGTKKVDVRVGFDDDFDYGAVAGSKFYFRSRDNLDNNTGHALYVADQTSGVVTKLMIMTGVGNEYPWDIRASGNSVVFGMYNAPSPNGSWQYWMSNGTPAGTRPFDTMPNDNKFVQSIYRFGNNVAYRFDDGVHGNEWWVLNGTTGVSTLIDLNPYGSANIDSEFVDGNTLRFRADDGVHGLEWWVSDGTVAGTRMYSDVNTSGASSNPDQFTVLNGVTYFRATNSVYGAELWKTDGTTAGTVLVKDIYPGSISSNFALHGVMGNKLFLSAKSDDVGESEPWISDGTTNGTVLLKDINTTTNWSGGSSVDYVTLGSTHTYFRAYDGTTRDYWVTDGTNGGTSKVDLIPGVDDNVDNAIVVGNKFYFRYRDDIANGTGSAYYVSDGTPGNMTRLMTLSGHPNSYDYPNDLRKIGNTFLFQLWNYPTPNSGWQWWKSDGTSAGTQPLDTVLNDNNYPGTLYLLGSNAMYRLDDGVHGNEWWVLNGTTGVSTLIDLNPFGSANIDSEFVDGNTLRFRADDGAHGLEWWVSDGTVAGTRMYSDANTSGASSNPDQFTVVNGVMYFRATDPVRGTELWKTDGTTAGTALVKDIYPGSISSNFALHGVMGNKLFFSAKSNGVGESEPWISDGTTNGTVLLKDINTTTNWSGGSSVDYVNIGTTHTYFRAYDGTTRDYWVTDGTTGGTSKVDLFPGVDDYVDYSTVIGNKFYFRYHDNILDRTGAALYVSDGTPGNMTKLMTLSGHPNSYDYPNDLRKIGNTFLFQLWNYPTPNSGWQWWKSDGTSAGTQPLDTVLNDNNYPGAFYQIGSNAMYRFDDGVHGNEWWVLNGLTGVSTLIDLNPFGSANIDSEFVDGNTLRFRADDGAHGLEWWVSDGTVAGTRMYSDANTSGASSNPDQFTVMNGMTYFRATDPVRGTELWKTDGTTAGTVLVKDIYPGSISSNFALHGLMGNKLFLSAKSDDVGESEPWISDGTTNGTVLLKDINTTTNWSGGSSVDYVNIGTTHTYFRAYDGTTRDFWVTDGTTGGTSKVDLFPGFDDYVDYSTVIGNKFYFRYRDNIANGTGSAYYVSDGTPGNMTKLVTMSDRPNAYDYPNEQRAVGNTLLFRWYNYPTQNNTYQWWMSDGTAQGTVPLDSNLTDMTTVTDATFFGNSVFYYNDDGIHGREWWLLDGLTGVRSRLGLRSVDQVVVEGSRIRFRADDGVHGLEYWTSDGTLAGTQLVQDINPVGAASNATSFVKMGGNTYFIANDATHPPAIWRSDGTALGTSAISNIGLNDGWTEAEITNLVATSNQIFFTAVDPIARKELFVSDGTLAGTHMVKDIYADNNWCWWCFVQIDNVKVINNKVIFRASDSVHGREMWVSDGTENGTFMLDDSYPGSSSSEPDWFYSAGNKLFYRAQDASGNYRLHSTDGTVAGTHTINYRSDNGASSTINDFRLVGNNALLWLEDGVHGWQWWFSDGTNSGTFLLDPYPTDGNWPEHVTVSGDKVFFRTMDANNDRELYVADSTGARRLGNLRTTGSSEPEQIYATANGVVFSADNDFYGREPWVSDGTVAGTRLFADINTRSGNVSWNSITAVNGKAIYSFYDAVRGSQIAVSDGSTQGTSLVQINSAGSADPGDLISLGSKALFSANNAQSDRQLYVSDGTAVGTTVLLNINAIGNDNVGGLVLINGVVYFAADDGVHGREMWVTDGTVAGTRMLADINSDGGSDPYGFTLSNGKIYFNTWDSTRGQEPYVTNGTTSGTVSLGDLNPYGSSNASGFTAAGTKTVFTAYDNQRGYEIWVTDGTVGGTQILADIHPFGDSYPQYITAVNGKAVFSAYNRQPSEGGHGRELWVTDGTLAGTQMIDINTSTTINNGNSDPYNFVQLGNRVMFSAYNSSRSRELWVTDGTSAGTRMYDFNTFGGGISGNPMAVGTNAIWTANDGAQAEGQHGEELWVSNGTAAGTSLVDINQSSWYNGGNSYPSGFTKNGNLTYFSARNATNGNELWQTDGTPAGTALAVDVNPTTESSGADGFVAAGNRYYFRAYTQQYGWELYTSTSATGSATLVKDIRVEGDSLPDNFTASGNKMYFRADDGINGRELWVTDGTSAGTRMVKNICRATYDCGSWIQSEVNGTILYQANDLTHGYQFYVSDGTESGTQSLDDNLNDGSNAENPVVLGNKIIYIWDDGISGRELWSYDITTKSRAIFKDIQVGAAGSSVDSLAKFGNYLYFRANNGTDGIELWRTDGTAVGTTMVANTHPTGDGNPDYFFQVGSKIFFRSEDGVNGRTLWVTNGTTAGTLQVSTSTTAETFVAGTTKLFYRSYDSTHGWELWVSDGTPAGTHLTKDLNNSSGDTWMDYQMTSGDQLFFRANNGVNGYELATSDGTEAGTLMLGDFNPTGDSWPDPLVPIGNGKLLFRVDDGTVPSHRNLWVSDGTIAGTRELTPSAVSSNVAGAWSFSPDSIVYWPSTGKAYFRGWDAVNGVELWSTDGTVAGTRMFKNFNPVGDSWASPMIVEDRMMVRAADGIHGEEPWISDGTVSGTIALGDLNTVGASSDPSWITKTTNRMFFSADDGNHGRELWVKDANGTRMVVDKNPFGYGSPEYITAIGDNVVYRYNDGVNGNELWFSDGTANGTIRLTNAVTNGDSNPDRVTAFGNKVIFRMYDTTNGWELWITDGTLAGTTLLKDIRSGGDGDPSDFTLVGSKMFFTADDGTLGRQLWVTDGTTSGTIALPANTSGNSNVSYLTAVGSTLYFSADDGANGYELWKSNGTVGGTTMVKDIRTGVLSSSPQQFTVSGSTLFFTATDDTHGRELWKSNGTSLGTTMVSDINPNGNSHPEQLVVDGSLLYFAANDGVSGREPFVSDGTAAGTGSIDINRSGGSRPERLARNNNILYFIANDGYNGTEMWSVNGAWLASTAPNVTRSENAPLPPSGVTRPVPATLVPVLTNAPSTTQAPSVPTSAPGTSSPGSSNPNSSSPEPTVPTEVPTTGSETSIPGSSNPNSSSPEPTVPTETPTIQAPTAGSETSAPNAIIPNTAPRVLTPPPAGSSTPSVIPVAEARQMEQERGQVSVQFNGEAIEVSQFRITGSGISSDQRDRSPSVVAEIRAQARQLVAAFDSFLPSGVTSEISVVDSPTGAKIIGLMVDPNNPSVSIPLPAESVILLRTPTGAMLMGGLNNAGRPSYVTSRGALAITKGGSVGLSISGMPANHNGELIIMSTPQSLGNFVVDEHGLFEGQATIPASLPFGTHTLLVSAGGMTIAVGVMVDNPVPMFLPATGSSNQSPVMVALFWVLMGLGLLMVRRRFRMGRN